MKKAQGSQTRPVAGRQASRRRLPLAKAAALTVAASLLVLSCQTTESGAGPNPAPPAPSGGSSRLDFASSGDNGFDTWRNGFAERALASGRKTSSVKQVLDGLTPIAQEVQTANFDNQAEFVKPIWDYAKTAVSATRVTNGLKKISDNNVALNAIEQSYAPPREIVAAIWGMESSYGSFIGNIDAPRALASQAAIGRRVDFNESQLLAIMQLIEDGSATRDQFAKASWAGAVGQTQFMPTTFVAHARDFDRDGRKDLWTNAGDALASAANYLTASGWRKGEPWAVEVAIPQGFDYSLGDGRRMSVSEWTSRGLSQASGLAVAPASGLKAELFLPAGSHGPAFLLFDNFGVIKKYNNADSYALAIGLLADRLAGRADLSRPWPDNIKLLTREQVQTMQGALNQLGYPAGTPDGLIGRNTRGALQRFQKDRGLLSDGFATTELYDQVVAAARA